MWFLADVGTTFDIGSNLTAVLIALIAAIPAIIAAIYARRASQTSTSTNTSINGRMTQMIQAKDDLINAKVDLVNAANTATAYAQGQNAPKVDTTKGPTNV